ncbi:MAG: nucleotidyl transferase AbiEii/AbiGii toxin family protein [bacterium]
MKYTDLPKNDQIDICSRVQDEIGLSTQIIEKDWWVTNVLRALFDLSYANNLSFKGGTSLSKCFNLINRFSEDVDIAIDREEFGLVGELSKTQISDKLRRATCSFVREKLQFDLAEKLIDNGINKSKFKVHVNITAITTTDPEIIEIEYQSAFQPLPYIKTKVIVEVSGRSMKEPTTNVNITSLIDKVYTNAPFVEKEFGSIMFSVGN